jgi:hypothetical protein
VRNGKLPGPGLDGNFEDLPDLTRRGDVLVTTMHTIRTRVDEAGFHLPSTGVHRLRVLRPDIIDVHYLATALTGSWNARFQAGSTIRRAPPRDLEVPLVPLYDQRRITQATLAARLLHEKATALADQATAVGSALLDAARYNAPLSSSETVGGAVQDEDNDNEGAT